MHAHQADGQDVVCRYRNPKDVVADMMEDDSMAGQLAGRFEHDSVTDRKKLAGEMAEIDF